MPPVGRFEGLWIYLYPHKQLLGGGGAINVLGSRVVAQALHARLLRLLLARAVSNVVVLQPDAC